MKNEITSWFKQLVTISLIQGPVAQSVASPIADPGVVSSIPAGPILSWRLIVKYCLRPFSSFHSFKKGCFQSRGVVVSCKGRYVHKVLVNRLVRLAQEEVWLG